MSRIVEFTTTVRMIEAEHEGKRTFDLQGVQIARVWPEDGPKRGKPEIVLVGDDFPGLLECIRVWDLEGRPSMVEAKEKAAEGRER